MDVRATRRATALLAMLILGLAAGCGGGPNNDGPRVGIEQPTTPLEGLPLGESRVGQKDDDGAGWFALLAGAMCMLIVGAAGGAAAVVFVRGKPGAAPARPEPATSPPPPAPTEDGGLAADRAALVNLLIRLDSRLDNRAMQEQVSVGLAKAGVEVIEVAAGTPFDAIKHQAGGAAYTDDEAKHMTVSATEQRGYRDRGKVLSLPIVTIYTYPGA